MTVVKNLKIQSGLPLVELVEVDTVILQNKMSITTFLTFIKKYPNLRIEREKNGKVVIMSPVKFGSGKREIHAGLYLGNWWLAKGEPGEIFSASTGIILKDTSFRSPDCGWISAERLAENLVEDEDAEFLKVAPDFIIEIRSFSDSIKKLKNKMSDAWMKNGVRLAWLIDPYKERVYIYRENETKPEEIKGFDNRILSGEKILDGFELNLEKMKIKKFKRKP